MAHQIDHGHKKTPYNSENPSSFTAGAKAEKQAGGIELRRKFFFTLTVFCHFVLIISDVGMIGNPFSPDPPKPQRILQNKAFSPPGDQGFSGRFSHSPKERK
ncbi:hypothetical protein [Angelakisella massiliensis]|uniref:hypothetical protein n=1 Tax=Angelakisella massiliensis TaxID=1871018 RepID=UPI0024B1C360|nr:hypothetical protein [Angelakisella massiliensis]